MPKEIKAFKCAFNCESRILVTKKAMLKHESNCFRNPSRKACQTCANFGREMETFYNPHHNGNPGSTDYDIQVQYCGAGIDITERLKCECPEWTKKV